MGTNFWDLVEKEKKKKFGYNSGLNISNTSSYTPSGAFGDLVKEQKFKSSPSTARNDDIAPIKTTVGTIGTAKEDSPVSKLSWEQQKFVDTYTPLISERTMPGKKHSLMQELQVISTMAAGEEKEKRKEEALKELKALIKDQRRKTLLSPLDDGFQMGDIIPIAAEGLDRLLTVDELNEYDLYSFLTGETRDADFWDVTLNAATRGYNNALFGEESFKANQTLSLTLLTFPLYLLKGQTVDKASVGYE